MRNILLNAWFANMDKEFDEKLQSDNSLSDH